MSVVKAAEWSRRTETKHGGRSFSDVEGWKLDCRGVKRAEEAE